MVAVAKKVENERPVFPFTAIIGQEEMKLALILNVIDPRIGGVMIMGAVSYTHLTLPTKA